MVEKLWGRWKTLDDDNLQSFPDSPGVYVIRCVNRKGRPIKIYRAGDTDIRGWIYIGETNNFKRRLQSFLRTAKDKTKSGHVAGVRYSSWDYNYLFPLENLEVKFCTLRNKKRARDVEWDLLRIYLGRFYDLPPLNFSARGL